MADFYQMGRLVGQAILQKWDDLATPDAPGKGSAMVGDKAPWTGSVARTQDSKNRDFLNLSDFGVFPNAGVDAYDGIQAALDAASAEKKTLYVPGGQYLYSKPLIVREHANIVGEGSFRTQFVKTARTSHTGLPNLVAPGGSGQAGISDQYSNVDALVIFLPPADGTYASNIRISGIDFTSGGSGRSAYGFYTPRLSLCQFEDVSCTNVTFGVQTKDSWMNLWNRVRMANAETGFFFDRDIYAGQPDDFSNGGTSNTFNSCWAHDCTDNGWVLRGMQYTTLSSCGADGILSNGSPTPQRAYRFENCKQVVLQASGCENVRGAALYIFNTEIDVIGFQGFHNIYGDSSLLNPEPIVTVGGSSHATITSSNFDSYGDLTNLQRLAVYDTAKLRLRGDVRFPAGAAVFGNQGVAGTAEIHDDNRGAAKAFVRFSAAGGTVTIIESYRVVSVERNGLGDFTITWFPTEGADNGTPVAMSDAPLVTHSVLGSHVSRIETRDASNNLLDPTYVTWVCF